LVMTAVPGAPRRLWLSSSPRRGAFGRLAALAVISVGRRFMGTLRVRTWRLCGADTTGRLMHHNKDSAGPVPDRVLPRIVENRDAFLFCKSRAEPCLPAQSADSITDNSGQFDRKSADFSRNISTPRQARSRISRPNALLSEPVPLDRELAPLRCRRRPSQGPAPSTKAFGATAQRAARRNFRGQPAFSRVRRTTEPAMWMLQPIIRSWERRHPACAAVEEAVQA
jgi:hypothetical protein